MIRSYIVSFSHKSLIKFERKMTSTVSPYKEIDAQIRPCRNKVKGQTTVVLWTNLVELESSMLYTMIQFQSFLCSGEEDVQVFLPYLCMAAILINGSGPSVQIYNFPLQQKFEENWSRGFRGGHPKVWTDDGRTEDDRRQVIIIAHPGYLVQVS